MTKLLTQLDVQQADARLFDTIEIDFDEEELIVLDEVLDVVGLTVEWMLPLAFVLIAPCCICCRRSLVLQQRNLRDNIDQLQR